LPTIRWDPRNPLFFEDKCMKGGYPHMYADIASVAFFSCPNVAQTNWVSNKYLSSKVLYENLFIVSKDEFESCEVKKLSSTTKQLLLCDSEKKFEVKYLKFKFSSIAASSREISFKVNSTYYFIATSTGEKDQLNNRVGGRCKDIGMKLAITICPLGSKCGTDANRCNGIPTPKTTTTTATPLTTVPAPLVVTTEQLAPEKIIPNEGGDIPIMVGQTAPVKGKPMNNGNKGVSIPLFILTALACFILGMVAILLVKWVKTRHSKHNRPPSDSSSCSEGSMEVFTENKTTVVDAPPHIVTSDEINAEKLLQEANRKYFSEENAGYRHSTEFKRLLSTGSHASSDRYSVTPVGEYA